MLQDEFEERALRLQLLQSQLADGIDQLDGGHGIPGDKVFAYRVALRRGLILIDDSSTQADPPVTVQQNERGGEE